MEAINNSAKQPCITVVVIAYNYGRFIEQAIESVLTQDFPMEEAEILVVDDGSTDDTAERVKKYAPRVRYLYKPNGGQGSALNLGIAEAQGEFVTFLDADDFFLPKKLAQVVEAFQSDPRLGMVYHRIQLWHEDTNERSAWAFVPVSGDLQREPQKFRTYLTPPNLAISFRRSALKKLLPIPENIRMLADCYLAALIPFLSPVLAVPEILAIYRIHGKNSHYTSSSARNSRVEMWRIVIDAMSKWMANNGLTRELSFVRVLQDHWKIILEREEFVQKPPGRIRFFRHLLRANRHQFPLMTRRLAVINYLNALGALVVGYERFPQWDKRREDLTRRVGEALGRGSKIRHPDGA